MSKIRYLIGSTLLFACGCAGMSNTDKGLGIGALVGAGAGALVGTALHNPLAGAAIGGATGAAIGGVTGAVADNEKEKGYIQGVKDSQAMQAAQVSARQMTMGEIIDMAHKHISDELIIQQIRSTGSNFSLTANDIINLRSLGVSEAVVTEMQTHHYAPLYAQPYVVAPAPVYPRYVYEPGPVVGVGFGYYHYRR
jgi:hypothetical protein